MTISDEKLMAYADGELPPEESREIELSIAADPALREQVEAHRRMRAQLAGAYAAVLEEPLPERLAAAASAERTANVVALSARRSTAPRWSVREWGAMAASLAAGLVVGFGAMRASPPLIAVNSEGMSASGALERALNTQLAGDEANAVRIGLTFRAEDGGYCRTFELIERATAGIACRDQQAWDVVVTAAQERQGEVRMASSPAAILGAVDSMIEGEPLDAEAEARARDAGWR
jgi:hypothetical protein